MLTLHPRDLWNLFLLSFLLVQLGRPSPEATFFALYGPSGYGTVQGKVVDELGKPLQGAKVYAEPVKVDGDSSGKLIFVTTNENGDFTLSQVQAGDNVICASKEEAFFPDTGGAALAVDLSALPRVHVEEGKITSGITVRLTKGGKLTGSIVDALSGEPVKDSRIRLTRVEDPRLYMSSGPDEQAHFEFVVPSKPFRLEVTASGYKTWKSDDHGGPIVVEPESIKEFSIQLQRVIGAQRP